MHNILEDDLGTDAHPLLRRPWELWRGELSGDNGADATAVVGHVVWVVCAAGGEEGGFRVPQIVAEKGVFAYWADGGFDCVAEDEHLDFGWELEETGEGSGGDVGGCRS